MLSNLLNKIRSRYIMEDDIKRLPKDTYLKISDFLKEQNIEKDDLVIICIGTNRTQTVDCLGPFVGSLLKEDKEFNVPVYGTMVKPVHALNLTNYITEIKNIHPYSKIIAVDACLCDESKIGEIAISEGSMQAGKGVGKNFGEVGEISILGLVAPKGIRVVEYDTDLNFISAMAHTIAKGLKEAFR